MTFTKFAFGLLGFLFDLCLEIHDLCL